MTAIYIIIAILIPLAILLCSPFKIYVSCINNKFSIKIRYLFLKKLLLPNKKTIFLKTKTSKKKTKEKGTIRKNCGKAIKATSIHHKRKITENLCLKVRKNVWNL